MPDLLSLSGLNQVVPKDVLLLLIGALASLSVRYLPAYIATFKEVTVLLGPWHTYHWSRVNDVPSFRYSTYTFKRRIYGLKISVVTEAGTATSYRGSVRFDGADVVIEANGNNHSETFSLRMSNPIENENTQMLGLMIAVDYDRRKFASIKLCSRKELPADEAKHLLQQVADPIPSEASLRVRERRAEA